MSLKDDIAAHNRGELDLESLKTRVGEQLRQSPSREDAMDILQTLYDSRKAGELPEEDYDELTQFVGETIAPQASSPPADDHSATRLATDYSSGGADKISEVEVGMRLRDRFILDEVVGVGGMGTVYRGRDQLKLEARDRDPYVAVKVLNETFKKRPEAFIALQREASRQQRLAHPNIATVYDFDRSEGVVFITMEFLNGRTLDQFIKQEVVPNDGLPIERVLVILRGLCAALSHAHERSIVHADFKPGNCFIAEGDAVKVLDFGIARAVKDPEAPLSDQTLFDPRSIGALTPAYASYEMLSDSEDADARDDIYALGCVAYELLTGRHPFHRIPADQAKANQLVPERIKGISRRQNEALLRALSFDRQKRTPTVKQFLEDMTDASSLSLPFKLPYVIGAAAVLLVGLLALWVPSYLEQREYDAVVELLQSNNRDDVNSGLMLLEALPAQSKRQVLQEQRQVLLQFYRAEMNRLIGVPDEVLDYAAADQVLARGQKDYPDSVALAELANSYEQRKNAYLSDLAVTFESWLEPQYLVPDNDGNGMPKLLARIAAIDPSNPLLNDPRIEGVYVDAAEQAISNEEYLTARTLVDAGKSVTANASTLADVDGRLTEIEQAQAYAAQVAAAAAALQTEVDSISQMADLGRLDETLAALKALESDHPAIQEAGATLARRFAEDIDSATETFALQDTIEFLDRYQATWTTLGKADIVQQVSERQQNLMRRQDELVAAARSAMRSPRLVSNDGIALPNLLNGLATIDATDPRIASLQEETFNQVRSRAQTLRDQQQWEEARDELARANPYAINPTLQEALAAEATVINEQEQAELERIAAAEQQAQAERLAAQQLAEARQREAEERARQQAIATASTAVEAAIAAVDGARLTTSVRELRYREEELRELAPEHPTLNNIDSRLQTTVISAIQQETDVASALELVAEAQRELGGSTDLQALREELIETQQAQIAAARQQQIKKARTALNDALTTRQLEARSGRTAALDALRELLALVAADSSTGRTAIDQFAQAHANAARPLIEAQRFNSAQTILEAGRSGAGNHSALRDAQALLERREERNRIARQERERQARLAALQDRFENELNALQLTRARQTLAEYRQLDSTSSFATTEGITSLLAVYAARIEQLTGRMELTNATNLLGTAREIDAGDARWQQLEANITAARRQLRVTAWFKGESERGVAEIRQAMDQLRRHDEDAYEDATGQWAKMAEERLIQLRNNRVNHNRFLTDAKLLIPGSRLLADIDAIAPPAPPAAPPKPAKSPKPVVAETPPKPAPAKPQQQQPAQVAETQRPRTATTPTTRPSRPEVKPEPIPKLAPTPVNLELADIAGRWCGENIRLAFTNDEMGFTVSNQNLLYPVVSYGFQQNLITVQWRNGRAEMVFEFGDFSSDGSQMTQLRGRRADSGDWQAYNRRFERCR
ncbi:MAG: protein kinase [Pseudomonadota bacterium]